MRTRIAQGVTAGNPEYESLLLGNEQPPAAYQLPGDALRALERQRWLETRVEEIGGIAQDMSTLHVQIGFNKNVQQQIRGMAERGRGPAVEGLRAWQLAAYSVFPGPNLGRAGRQWSNARRARRKAAVPAERKGRGFSRFVVGGLIAAAILLAILLFKV